jgi:hypothetical protein
MSKITLASLFSVLAVFAQEHRWEVAKPTTSMDGVTLVSFGTISIEPMAMTYGNTWPVLGIRCTSDKKLDVFCCGNAVLQSTAIRYKFDDGKPVAERWEMGADRKMLRALDAEKLVKQFPATKIFYFEFTPFQSGPRLTKFDLSGFVDQFNKSCGDYLGKLPQ